MPTDHDATTIDLTAYPAAYVDAYLYAWQMLTEADGWTDPAEIHATATTYAQELFCGQQCTE